MANTAASLLWIDLEMTGLEPDQDVITEVAAIVTDWDFNELATYESGVQHPASLVDNLMNKSEFWSSALAADRKTMLELSERGKPETDVQQELLALINANFTDQPVLLAGNSVHQDRRFIRQHWSVIEARLHYRMLDVSAWKVVMEGKYGREFNKKSVHRAMDDIRESIAELKYYLEAARF